MAKIKLVTPVYRFMEVETMKSLMQLAQTSKNQIEWYPPEGDSFIQRVRNMSCRELGDCDYLMFIDDDICWNLDFNPVDRLVEHGLDLVCGEYCIRGGNFHPVWSTDEQLKKIKESGSDECIWPVDNELREVKYAGTGFMLISAKLIKEIYEKYPYPFMSFIDEYGDELSEDYAFCRRAAELGYKIFVDCAIKLNHIGKIGFNINSYLIYKNEQEKLKNK